MSEFDKFSFILILNYYGVHHLLRSPICTRITHCTIGLQLCVALTV